MMVSNAEEASPSAKASGLALCAWAEIGLWSNNRGGQMT